MSDITIDCQTYSASTDAGSVADGFYRLRSAVERRPALVMA